MLGAKVIAGAGADERVAAALEQGADFGVNYRTGNLTEAVMKLTDNKGVDVVCENIADPTLWPSAFASLAMNGRLVTAGAHGGGTVTARCETALHAPAAHLRRRGDQYCRRGKISPSRGRGKDPRRHQPHDALERSADAHRIVEQNQIVGKMILEPGLD